MVRVYFKCWPITNSNDYDIDDDHICQFKLNFKFQHLLILPISFRHINKVEAQK